MYECKTNTLLSKSAAINTSTNIFAKLIKQKPVQIYQMFSNKIQKGREKIE